MQRKLLAVFWLMLPAAMVGLLSPVSYALPTADLVAIACDSAQPATVRSAAADVVSARWIGAPSADLPDEELFQYSGDASAPVECRSMGFEAQVARIFETGDPLVGEPLTDETAQAYADAVTTAPTLERAYVLATAVARQVRSGFAIVPGGLTESLNRVQTCLAGAIETNQDNLVDDVAIDCGVEAMRRAIADSIATSFYVFFRTNPAINLSCDDLRAQAEDAAATAEARWAAAKAFVFDTSCTPSTVEALEALATSGGSAELRQATVRPLAEALVASDQGTRELLFAASSAATTELRQAYAYAAGVKLSAELDVDAACNPTTATTGVLSVWAVVSINGNTEPSLAAIAPLARFYASSASAQGRSCSLTLSEEPLRLSIGREALGANLPLMSFLQLSG